MNIKEFEKWCEDRNKKETDYIYFDHRNWRHKIDYLDKFVKVFWNYWSWDCFVDEVIWLINDTETVYIWEEFLDLCIENKITWEKARDLYHQNLDENMDRKEWEYISYKETLNKLWK